MCDTGGDCCFAEVRAPDGSRPFTGNESKAVFGLVVCPACGAVLFSNHYVVVGYILSLKSAIHAAIAGATLF